MQRVSFSDPLSKEVSTVAATMGYALVEFSAERIRRRFHVHCVVHHPDGVTLDGLTALHQALEPRIALVLDDRDAHVEFSSPGIDRQFKSFHEFQVFVGKRVQFITVGSTTWMDATIVGAAETVELQLADRSVLQLAPDQIQKARLVD